MTLNLGPFSLERVEQAWKMVQDRVLKAAAALEKAGVPYAVAGASMPVHHRIGYAPESR